MSCLAMFGALAWDRRDSQIGVSGLVAVAELVKGSATSSERTRRVPSPRSFRCAPTARPA